MSQGSDQLLSWCRNVALPVIHATDANHAAELSIELERSERLRAAVDEQLSVCFLGNAGVGKSTLINAMVAGKSAILPQGGVGPLTAQATSVRYSKTPYFEAAYHSTQHLNQLLFVVERGYERELSKLQEATEASSSDIEELVEPSVLIDTSLIADDEQRSVSAEYWRQARQLVEGSPIGELDIPYLADALRSVLGLRPRWNSQLRAEDVDRLNRLGECIRRDAENSYRSDRTGAEFTSDLSEHASGALAPVIRRLTVGWDSPLLQKGLVLVDLPGVGVANDIYRKVTNQYVSQDARAIVLVTDRSGVSQATADLLRDSRFFVRLLSAADDPEADQVQLLIAVVKADLVADNEWSAERSKDKTRARKWTEHFESVRSRLMVLIETQLRDVLGAMVNSGDVQLRTERQQMIDRILKSVQIHPVSAVEFRKLLEADDEDRAHITSADQSRLPQLMASLAALASERRSIAEARHLRSVCELWKRTRSTLELIQSQQDQDTRAKREIEQLERNLDPLRRKLTEELRARQGGFRNYLTETVPQSIDSKVALAARSASDDIRRYVNDLKRVPWATLRAAVRRGGAFDGARRIDLPVQLSVRFEEPVALVWGRDVLAPLRSRTGDFAAAYLSIANEVVDWASSRVDVRVQRLAQLEHDAMSAQASGVSSFGNDQIDSLRQRVRAELISKVEVPIRQRCESFVAARKDVGAGVKNRMLELVEQLMPEVVKAAEEVARAILHSNFDGAKEELRNKLERLPDPVQRMTQVLVSSGPLESPEAQEAAAKIHRATSSALKAAPAPLPECMELG